MRTYVALARLPTRAPGSRLPITRVFVIEMETRYRFADLPLNRGDHSFNIFLPPCYIFGETIGQGKFATVKLAFDLRRGHYVAIKCFTSRSRKDMMLDDQILQEMMAMKGLVHDHIVRMNEAICYGNKVFFVMEYCPHGDLRHFINRSGPLSEGFAREFFGDICKGVQKIHGMDLVHRDLKLDNLYIDLEYRIKIGDFGCARRQMDKSLHTITGSYAYGAPELIRGDKHDAKKADIWSMGVILFAMVTGRLPYHVNESLMDMLMERRKPPSRFPSSVSQDCCAVICRMLTYNPLKRFHLNQIIEHPWVSNTQGSICKDE